MGPPGDDQDEMRLHTESDTAVLLRRALIEDLDPGTTRRHLDAMVAATGTRRGRPTRWLAAAGLAAALGGGALAALPDGLPNGPTSPPAPAEAVERAEAAREAGLAQASADHQQQVLGHASAQGDEASAHGKAVSDLARTTEAEGRDKGQEISELASSKAEDHRKDGEHRPEEIPTGKPDDLPGTGNQP